MAVAIRHGRKSPKNGTKEGPRTGVKTSGKTTLLAGPIYIGQAQGERNI